MKVLVIDDSPMIQQIIQGCLKNMNNDIEIELLSDGHQAISTYQAFEPDLIILDVIMPEITGLEIAKKIRDTFKSDWVPIIFLSGKTEPEDILKGIEAGGDDYISKPIDPIILKAKNISLS